MAPNGQNGINGHYRFVDGAWKYTRVLQNGGSGSRPTMNENTPLMREVTSILGAGQQAGSMTSSATLFSNRPSRDMERGSSSTQPGIARGGQSRLRDVDTDEELSPAIKLNEDSQEAFIRRNVENVKNMLGKAFGMIAETGEVAGQGEASSLDDWVQFNKIKGFLTVVIVWMVAAAIVVFSFIFLYRFSKYLVTKPVTPPPATTPYPGYPGGYPYPQYPNYPYPPPGCYCPPPGQPYPGYPPAPPGPPPAPVPTTPHLLAQVFEATSTLGVMPTSTATLTYQ
ncbi:hypothetical protein HK101_000282 [Irineochytrium annulatum]|nr:hypothetical protein HK101_000282 [Irineochytrium annulatum]